MAPDTKFIEQHAGVLGELLDLTLGERGNRDGVSFAERFHLREELPQVRFRFLDDGLRTRHGWPVTDCSVPITSFAALEWHIPRVLIVENRTVFLCVPPIADTIAIWGAGKAVSLLSSCGWIRSADAVYWGDCDEAGYGILSALRERIPHLRSVLMGIQTWRRWSELAVLGKRDATASYTHLTPEERAARDAVVAGPWMIEQERIPPAQADAAVLGAFELPD